MTNFGVPGSKSGKIRTQFPDGLGCRPFLERNFKLITWNGKGARSGATSWVAYCVNGVST
jgi:hypothetical protein